MGLSQAIVLAMLPLTLAIITRDEEARISGAIASAGDVAEVLVLDSGSTDRTVEIARGLGARVECVDWPGYGAQKNRALEMATEEWVLSIDADEQLSPELMAEFGALFEEGAAYDAYAVLRRNHWKGQPVRGGVYGPSWKTRLIRRGTGRWEGGILHETLEAEGSTGRLKGFLEHTPYRDEEDFLHTSENYAVLFAKKAHAAGRVSHWWDRAFRPLLHFVKAYLLKMGFLDGKRGFDLARFGAREVAMKWRSLRVLAGDSTL